MSMSMNKRMAGLTADRRLKKGLACLMTVLLLAGCGPAKPKASEGRRLRRHRRPRTKPSPMP